MTRAQAENCLTLASWLADEMTDEEFTGFWACPWCEIKERGDLFDELDLANPHLGLVGLFSKSGRFVLSGDLTAGLGVPAQRVTRCAIATALVAVCDFAGWETA